MIARSFIALAAVVAALGAARHRRRTIPTARSRWSCRSRRRRQHRRHRARDRRREDEQDARAADRDRQPRRRRRHHRRARGRQERARRLHDAARHQCDARRSRSASPRMSATTRKDFASIGFVGAVPNAVVVHPTFSGPHRSPNWSRTPRRKASRSNTARPASAPSIISPASCSRTSPASRWRTSPIEARARRSAICSAATSRCCSARSRTCTAISATARCARSPSPAPSARSLLPDIPHGRRVRLPGLRGRRCDYGLVAPAGTPRPIIDQLNQRAARRARRPRPCSSASVHEGVEPLATTPEEFTAMIDREEPKWSALIKDRRPASAN